MAEAEESEMTEQFGMLLRQVTGSGLQAREVAERRRQMKLSEENRGEQQSHAQQAQVASAVRRDLYDKEFWRTAGSESIADNVTVASALAKDHPEARTAYMHASDLLRNDYGINIEQMNRDHPTSHADRHQALREALDNYFANQQLDSQADQVLNETDQQQEHQTQVDESAEQGVDADAQRDVGQAQDAEAEAAQLRSQATEAAQDEQLSFQDADRYGAETQQDKTHTLAEEQAGGRQPHPYSQTGAEAGRYHRLTAKDFERVQMNNPQAADVRRTTAQNFPNSTRDRVGATNSPQARKNLNQRGLQQSKQQNLEVQR